MRLHNATGWRSLLFATLLITNPSSSLAKKSKPGVEQTVFNFIPYNLNYFDDSDTLLFHDVNGNKVQRSTDAGASWEEVKAGSGEAVDLVMHPFDNQRAFIISAESTHWKTEDRGKSWEEWTAKAPASVFREALTFHAADPDRIIFNAMDCIGIFCEELTMYTTDGFKSGAKFLRADTVGCHWAKASTQFTTQQDDLNKDRILCVVKGRFTGFSKDYRLLVSDDFFQKKGSDIQEFEPELEPGRTVQGIVNLAVVTSYLVVAASAENTDEMALYVTDDTIKWHRAIFPHDHKLVEEAYTILEGTNYSIQIDVLNSRLSSPMGVFLSSNSNGTYFVRNMEHTNRNKDGLVDFEKMSGVQGIVFLNVVDNWEKVEKDRAEKEVVSKISFNDGKDWEDMTVDGKVLHLHSVTDLSNSGRVFSSPAPGLVMGVGNVGKHLESYKKGNTYISDDAGLTWRLALEGPYKYEFGGQGTILVAVKDGKTDEVKYSMDHGKEWHDFDLEQKIRPYQLTTTADSTSLKFMLEAVDAEEPAKHAYLIALDFEEMHEAECGEDDMEKWYARLDDKGESTCLMGHKQWYWRRKADAKCFVKSDFKDPVVNSEPCECTDADYECDFNFVRSSDRKECLQAENAPILIPDGACKAFGPDDTFKGSSGWRLIPGNLCKPNGKQKDEPVDRKCAEVTKPSSGKIDTVAKDFDGKNFMSIVYLERTGISQGEDETVIMRTDRGVFLSHDHGKKWEQILKDEAVLSVTPHPHNNDMVFFITPGKEVFYSTERGKNIRSFKVPHPPADHALRYGNVMGFHKEYKDWIIWMGGVNCEGSHNADCHAEASITTDRGDRWDTLERYVRRCEFIKNFETRQFEKQPSQKEKEAREKLIYCEVRKHERNDDVDNPYQLKSSTDFFVDEGELKFEAVVDFATMAEFIVVATKDSELDTMNAHVSVDGQHFAAAHWPYGFKVDHERGYTVLESSTHAVFLHVTVDAQEGLEHGALLKSNSNGTFYTEQLLAVDRDTVGYVDFEKMFGIEGVAMVNQVANAEDGDYAHQGKKLKTMITHNDGAEWNLLPPPALDADKKKFGCSGNLEKCALHFHGYTERPEKSHTYSSASAIGLMLGTGNVGEYLTGMKEADTFMTSDAGLSWKSVKKGRYMWEFGDQGSIVVIVLEDVLTKVIYYSTDEGDTWEEYKFYDQDVRVQDLSTVPSDNSREFLLWCIKENGALVVINLDFSGLTDVQCKLNENDVTGGDYLLWQPKHPNQDDDCLFGHVAQYHRKRPDAKCYNGRMIPHLHNIAKNCTCTRRDYECDFNYYHAKDGSCQLVNGFTPPDNSIVCSNENTDEYFTPTGYRRIPQTTCTTDGARGMDESVPVACPGKEDLYRKKHGISGVGIFFAVIIPFALAGAIGYYVWKNWSNKFGQIRLGEQSSFDSDSPMIKYPVLIIAGVAAAIQATPLLVSSLWRSASTALGRGGSGNGWSRSSGGASRRFTTRDSFARSRGDYDAVVGVDEDEGELLGSDSDEEV